MIVGVIPEPCTGMPVVDGDVVGGLVLGRNQANEDTVIAVDAEKLDAFADDVIANWPEVKSE